MYYSRQIRNLCVQINENPKIEGKIKDVIIDWQKPQVKGFWLDSFGLWKNSYYLPLENVLWLNQRTVIIASVKNLRKTRKLNKEDMISLWYGTPIYNQEGGDWGTLSDILWDYPDGAVLGFAVSQGIFRDFKKGWYFLPKEAIFKTDKKQNGIILNENCPYFNEVIRLC